MKPEIKAALGRLFLMLSRPYQTGDDDTYNAIRSLLWEESQIPQDTTPNYARSYPLYQEASL